MVIKRDGKWWTASLPSFPGAYGQGRTRVAAVRSLASAVRDLVELYATEQRTKRPATRPRHAHAA